MYSLIWIGWILVELLIENHQILRFSGCDWIFFQFVNAQESSSKELQV